MPFPEQALGAHDMQDKNLAAVKTIENAARRLNNLPIAGAREFFRATATLWMIRELLDVTKDPPDKLSGRCRILECDVVSDCIQICQRWF